MADNDCNGELDDDPQDIKWYQDEDQDSYGVEEFCIRLSTTWIMPK